MFNVGRALYPFIAVAVDMDYSQWGISRGSCPIRVESYSPAVQDSLLSEFLLHSLIDPFSVSAQSVENADVEDVVRDDVESLFKGENDENDTAGTPPS